MSITAFRDRLNNNVVVVINSNIDMAKSAYLEAVRCTGRFYIYEEGELRTVARMEAEQRDFKPVRWEDLEERVIF